MNHPFHFRKWQALIFGGLVVLLADFGVRQVYLMVRGNKPRPAPEHRQASYRFHHGLRPMTSHVDNFGPLQSMYFVNSLGMRDASCREVPLRSSRPRLLISGDSFVEGVGVSWEQSLAGRLAAALAPRGVEVLNAGVASYAPTMYDVWVTHLIQTQGLQVDRVAVFLDMSDIKDEFHYEIQPDGSVRYANFGALQGEAEKLAAAEYRMNWVEVNVEGRFVLLGALIRNLRLLWLKSPLAPWYLRAKDDIPLWGYDWGEYRGPYEPYVEKGLAKADASLARLAAFLQGRGIPMTLVVYPWPRQTRRGLEESRVATYWREWSRRHGVDFVSLFPLFIRAGPAEEVIRKYHNRGDAHWNPEGNAFVADFLLSPASGFPIPGKKVTAPPQSGKSRSGATQ